MLIVSPFYDHYTIRIHASCHNNTAPPIKLNKLSCSNTNLILLKQSCLIGQLNVPKLVSKMHVRRSGVYLYRVPTVGRPTLGFWVVPGPDSPLFCCALPISTRPQPPASPATCRPRTTWLYEDFGRSLTAVTILHTCPSKLTSKWLIHYIYVCLVIFFVNILLG